METMTLIIRRFDPEQDREGRFQSFQIPEEAARGMTVVSALKYIQEKIDPTLAFYYSCEQALCRGCLVLVDEKPTFACTEPVGNRQKIEPLPGLPVLRDLVVKFIRAEIELDEGLCTGCGLCVDACPMDIFMLVDSGKAGVQNGPVRADCGHAVDCIGCRRCEEICPVRAIVIRPQADKGQG